MYDYTAHHRSPTAYHIHYFQVEPKKKFVIFNEDSSFSPYDLPTSKHPAPKNTDVVDYYNQKYVARAASSPLTPEELESVRGHLGDIFHERATISLSIRWSFMRCWARDLEMTPAPQHQDEYIMRSDQAFCDCANKQTAIYFVGGNGHRPEYVGHRYGYSDRRLGCYIYRMWHKLHGGRPDLQRQYFFAKAFRLPKDEALNWTVPDLVAAHRRRCDALAARFGSEAVCLRCRPSAFPMPVWPARTWSQHSLSLGHLFRAVLLVADEHVLPEECPIQPVPLISNPYGGWKVAMWLEKIMPECRVLMVRTGDDAHLSRPLSFEKLISEGKTVPLDLGEERLAKGFDVVRVKIDVAMRFLFDLKAEEVAAIPRLQRISAILTEEREGACHAWVESVLRHASREEVGIDGNHYTWEAVRRMWAEQDGDIFNRCCQNETQLLQLYSWYGTPFSPPSEVTPE